jgi:integrase/recombinase XerC
VQSLDAAHLDLTGVRIAVRGKGSTEREWLPLATPTAEALAAWVIARGPRSGPLFPRERSGRFEGRISLGGINRIVARLGAAAGVAGLRPHGFRHTAITAALDATGGDVRSVARFSRHADVRTLQRYDDARGTAVVAAIVAGAVA